MSELSFDEKEFFRLLSIEYDRYDKDSSSTYYSSHFGPLNYLDYSTSKSYHNKYDKIIRELEKVSAQLYKLTASKNPPANFEKIFDNLINREMDLWQKRLDVHFEALVKNQEARIKYRLKIFPEECEFHY